MPAGSFKIRRAPFNPFAFFAFSLILNLAVFKNGLHLDFAPAGTEKFLRGAGGA
jgi:hypothetical protein